MRIRDIITENTQGVAEGKQPGQPVIDAILKVMPISQEIWFHGSRATGKHRRNSDTDILVVVPDDIVGAQYLGMVRILQKLSSHFDNYDIQPTKAGNNIHRIAQEEGQLLWSNKPKQGVAEGKIKLSTDPNRYGADVDDYQASGPVINIPATQLVGFEPDDKMNQPASKANVEKIVSGLKQGAKLPPLLVRKYKKGYQVLDGHHRFRAYKLLGIKSIPAQVVPAEDIEELGKQAVAEGRKR